MTPDGYFTMSQDPDGTRHGVFGAARHGYFEATPNHDAGCFGVTDDATNRKIISRGCCRSKATAKPGSLAPYGLIIPNYPAYDDSVYGGPYGQWVNGGHWTHDASTDEYCLPAGRRVHASVPGVGEDSRLDGKVTAPTPRWQVSARRPGATNSKCHTALSMIVGGASGGLLCGGCSSTTTARTGCECGRTCRPTSPATHRSFRPGSARRDLPDPDRQRAPVHWTELHPSVGPECSPSRSSAAMRSRKVRGNQTPNRR